LRNGFDVNSEDEKGNTLLLVACQNGHRKMLDLLLNRMADINHQNSNGNTALHYALAFDSTGEIAEFLIEKGANDMLENKFGLSPYDGLGESGM
jgi:ankyrin repeat protein